MNQDDLEIVLGVPYRVVDSLCAVAQDEPATVAALLMLKWSLTWDATAVLLNKVHGTAMTVVDVRRRVRHALEVFLTVPLKDPRRRLTAQCRYLPNATALIDTFPVNCRGPATMFNGKYKGKCRKYQLLCSLSGDILVAKSCRKMHRAFDGTILNKMGCGIELEGWEKIVGDKAYIACEQCIAPSKMRRGGPLSEEEARTNKYIQLIRTPVERAVSRLHRFRLLKWCATSEDLCDGFVHLAALTVNLEKSQKWSTWLIERTAVPAASRSADLKAKCGASLRSDDVDLRGRSSSKRRRGDSEFKRSTLDYEKACAKCKQLRSACTCRGTGRGRGRGRGRSVTVSADSESSATCSSTSCSATTASSSFASDTSDSDQTLR